MCGDRKWEQVPVVFAQAMVRLISPSSIPNLPESPTTAYLEPELYVLFAIENGSKLDLFQIVADAPTFLKNFRKGYFRSRRLFRRLFTFRRFSHCEVCQV